MLFKAVAVAAAVSGAVAQRPMDTPICDYYTTALLKNNTAANQKLLLTLVVNTAIIGNYTKPNVGIKVAGILAPGTFNGTKVDLLPYFNGGLASTNTGDSVGRSVNFLDGGGAAPLMMNKPADDMDSRQYFLLTHLYEFFGALLGCSMMGNDDYPNYAGEQSMGTVHKFMSLSAAEVGYFIQQVAMSAASFGVADSDLEIVGKALNTLFGYRCAPPVAVIPSQPPQMQSICIDETCPLHPNATCSIYPPFMEPAVANHSMTPSNNATSSGSMTSGMTSATGTMPAIATGGATAIGISVFVIAGGLAAAIL